MRILIEVGHPKHVHLFRPLLKRWKARGDIFQVVTRDKDITHALLDRFGVPYVCLSKQQRSYRSALELLVRWLRCVQWVRCFRADIVLSVAGITTALPSRILGVPNIALTDTETAVLSNRIAFPFADCILTPEWFTLRLGPRHRTYRGFHEWAYLHPDEFQPKADLVRAEGIDPANPYALVRLVKWDAAHDRGESGLQRADTTKLVNELGKQMPVYISAEGTLPAELQTWVAKFNIHQVHHVLAFATLVIGESPSMATEAALLGVPAVLASSWAGRCGNMQVLEQKFNLMRVFSRGASAVQTALDLATQLPSRDEIRARRDQLTHELECVPDVIERHILDLTT